ncbi:abortive infection system antitoxin AbiGi family protein [uncultured Dokdonia sp.]|uniref:abortive infection system antitoxin AbiGi family protein n=1 Tax=uncultured Dokdonia sp. TaxID=575653 RepID=UPI0026109122|nr:abortive infection system antitoxin AbiGi family protein [uncultured Dokdonia sp.]
MSISPSTVFHFTSKKGLEGILSDNFKLKYCVEKLNHSTRPVEVAIPMVSFCDIKISEITEHIEKYGHYGIGLSKEWAVEKGLNPVVYLNSSSKFAADLIDNMREVSWDMDIPREERVNKTNIIRYSKVYEGPLFRKGKTIEKYRFADEREWRYVPPFNEDFFAWHNLNQYDTPAKKRSCNSKLKNERLYFNANQILYIIVKKESEIDNIIAHIRHVKGKNYTMHEIDRLTTRILSYERILNDF